MLKTTLNGFTFTRAIVIIYIILLFLCSQDVFQGDFIERLLPVVLALLGAECAKYYCDCKYKKE